MSKCIECSGTEDLNPLEKPIDVWPDLKMRICESCQMRFGWTWQLYNVVEAGPKIGACPFCTHNDDLRMLHHENFRVECGSCGAEGPIADTAQEARTRWEKSNPDKPSPSVCVHCLAQGATKQANYTGAYVGLVVGICDTCYGNVPGFKVKASVDAYAAAKGYKQK